MQQQTSVPALSRLFNPSWVLWLGPLLLCSLWGTFFADAVYAFLNQVQLGEPTPLWWQRPFFTLLLILANQLGLDLAPVALLLSGLGWGLTAVSLHRLAKINELPKTAVSLLLLTTPALLPAHGQATLGAIGLVWLSTYLGQQQRTAAHALTLAGLALLYPNPATLLFIAAHLILLTPRRHRLLYAGAALLLTVGGYLTLPQTGWQWVPQFHPPALLPAFSTASLWLLPLLLLGLHWLWPAQRRWLWLPLLWAVVVPFFDATVAGTTTAVSALFLVAAGAYQLSQWLNIHPLKSNHGTLLLLAPLLSLQLGSLWQAYQARPTARHTLENEMGHWLTNQTSAAHSLAAPARVAYLAQRHPQPFPAIDAAPPAAFPDYLVTSRSINSFQLAQTDWFQENYEARRTFDTPYESSAPYTVWGYRPTLYGITNGRSLNVNAADQLALVGYQLSAQLIQPSDTLTTTLFWRTSQPASPPVDAIIRLESPQKNVENSIRLPRGESEVTETGLPMQLPADLPIGAYAVTLSLKTADSDKLWPLYRNNDQNALDRVHLGQVVVPWQGDLATITPTAATFGDTIQLLGYTVSETADLQLDITLYWQATATPTADYVVFVHLLNPQGQLVANHDSPPANGNFPTTAFLPTAIVPDQHQLALSPDLPAGEYRLAVGLYLPDNGERLTVRNETGEVAPDRAWPLTAVFHN